MWSDAIKITLITDSYAVKSIVTAGSRQVKAGEPTWKQQFFCLFVFFPTIVNPLQGRCVYVTKRYNKQRLICAH